MSSLASFRHKGSCWWYPRFMLLVNCLNYSWRTLLMVSISSSSWVSRIGFSIQFKLEFDIVWSYSCEIYCFSFPLLCPVCGHFHCWLGWWLLRLWRCLAYLLGCSQFRSSVLRLVFSTSISCLFSSGTWYSWICTFLILAILSRCRIFSFSIWAQICPLLFP